MIPCLKQKKKKKEKLGFNQNEGMIMENKTQYQRWNPYEEWERYYTDEELLDMKLNDPEGYAELKNQYKEDLESRILAEKLKAQKAAEKKRENLILTVVFLVLAIIGSIIAAIMVNRSF